VSSPIGSLRRRAVGGKSASLFPDLLVSHNRSGKEETMSETPSRDELLASEDSPFILPGDGREGNSSDTGGTNQPLVQTGNPPKDPDGDDH
jgi:hypothetical protein